MSTPTSPTRRVLGDKTPNASLKRRAHEPLLKPPLDYSMPDEPRALTKTAVDMRIGRTIAPTTGQKRRIHEVDGTEEQEQRDPDRTGSTSPLTILAPEPTSEADEGDSSSTIQASSTTSTLLASSHASQASQEPLIHVEDQFDIQDEMSQRSLDKIHATPIPNNSPPLQPPLQPTLLSETSQDSVRMSSFIDFESGGLEGEDNLKLLPAQSTNSSKHRVGKEDVDEKAETLRTRLQLAYYKVQTNQISKPFSRLEQPRPSSPDLPPQPSSLSRTSPEGIVAAARARATQQRKPAVRNLNSMPIPTILPTAYSARRMPVDEEKRLPQSSTISSSTPGGSHKEVEAAERSKTPVLSQEDRTTFPKTPMQLSSPPRSDVDDLTLKHGPSKKVVNGLTSSVVKGEAANGLLELMRAAAA